MKKLLFLLLLASCGHKPSFKVPLVDLERESAWAKGQYIPGPGIVSKQLEMVDNKCNYLIAYTRDSIVVQDSLKSIRGLLREAFYVFDHPVVAIYDNTGDTVLLRPGDTIYLHSTLGGENGFKSVNFKYQINEKSVLATRYGYGYKLRIRATTTAREIEKRYSAWRLSIRQHQRYN